MTREKRNKYWNKKYWICCPLCDNDKCVRGTDKCEAEQWEKEQKALLKRAKQEVLE